MLTPRSQLRRRLRIYLVLGGFLVLFSGAGFAAFESHQVSSFWEGLWWSLSLMSTVGFIGEAPETVAGRLLSALLMVSGFGLMALVTAAVASLFVREEQLPEQQAEERFAAEALELLAALADRLEALEARIGAQASSPDPSPGPRDDRRPD